LMRGGRLEQVGAPTELYFTPRNAFVAGFFGDINRIESVARDGVAATPFGTVDAAGIEDGTPVEVLIRPEALRLQPPGGVVDGEGAARVMAARLLGRTSLVHLSVNGGGGPALHLHARIAGRFLPAENEMLDVHLDRGQTFVFPLDKESLTPMS
ncbi:MAG: TOBE domain-containing protein, partial [Rhodovibrionaceae bacterium]|nr:TOBE domain-containing protein [Rhodovibrionaceae bacterium]